MEVYRISDTLVSIETENIATRAEYNPDTKYLLMNSTDYGRLNGDQIKEITEQNWIEGIYNTPNIRFND